MKQRGRFKVTSVTGWAITPSTTPRFLPSKLKAKTTWYVVDRAYCHRVVGIHSTARAARGQQRTLNRWDREADE